MTPERVHFIGIGGVGMSALAQMDLARGAQVSGSDSNPGPLAERLRTLGALVFANHSADHIRCVNPDLVVYTDAVTDENPELAEAKRARIPVFRRAEYLGRRMEEFAGIRIGVAGTHGKTTTTAMLGDILVYAQHDPTVLVGGEYGPYGGNLRLGNGPFFVTEACEAFHSFHYLHPDVAIVTNIEPDHLDCYGTPEGVVEGFATFVRGIRPGGILVIRAGGKAEQRVIEAAKAAGVQVWTFGWAQEGLGDVRADNTRVYEGLTACDVVLARDNGQTIPMQLQVAGSHNVLNALAAIGAAMAMGVELSMAVASLESFRGVHRRFEVLGERDGVTVVDDYAHHPTEIKATIAATRQRYPGRRLLAVFQPHLFSRTRDFRADFALALGACDLVVLTGVYQAREGPVEGGDTLSLARELAQLSPTTPLLVELNKKEIPRVLEEVSRPGDVVLIMGAGDIRKAGEEFVRSMT